MKTLLHLLGKFSIALAMSFISLTAYSQGAFICQDGFSYIVKTSGTTSTLFRVSLVPTYSETLVGIVRTSDGTPIPVDAIGYNVVDNYIWGFQTGSTNIVRIGNDGVSVTYPVSGLPASAFNGGDVDANGNLFLNVASVANMYRINLSTIPHVAVPITGTGANLLDISVNDAGTQVYGYSAGTGVLVVRAISGTTYTQTTQLSNMWNPTQTSITVQNTFYDKHDRLFAQKTNGEIYAVAPGALATTDGMVKLSGNAPPASSDGAHCRNASVYVETQPTFNCNDGNAYVITHGSNGECTAFNNNTNLATINTQNFGSTSQTNITNTIQSGLINAIGFNALDGYLWGYRFGTGHLARIGSDGSVQYFPIPGLLAGCGGTIQDALGAGDITTDGIYYGYQGNKSTGGKTLFRIDLNPTSSTYLTILNQYNATPSPADINISDIAFNPVDKNFYGVGVRVLEGQTTIKRVYRITGTGVIENLGNITFTGENVVATFCDPAGNFYFQASSGPLYRIPRVNGGGSLTPTNVSNSQIGASNGDAARCPLTFFAGITLSGNIWNDTNINRIKDGEGNTVTNDPSETLTVYLVDDANVIIGKADVNADGTWTMPSIPTGTFTLSLSNDASLAISSSGAAIAQGLPDEWVYTGTNFGTAGAPGSWNGTVTVGAGDTQKSNLNFGIQQIPTAGNGESSAVNIPGSASVDVPLTTFTNQNPSSDGTPGTVASIAITAIPDGATSITINGVKYGDDGQTIPVGGVVIQTGLNGLPIDGTTISVDPTADGATTVTIPFVAIDNAGARSVNTGVEGTAVLNLTAAPISISGNVWNDANGTATKDGSEPFTNAGGLFANLVTPAGVVLQSVAVNPTTGQYDFSNVPANTTYNIILTEDNKTGATDLTESELPSGWANTGVNLDGTPATGNTTGVIAINAGIVPVVNQNFGIERIPTADAVTLTNVPNSTFSTTPPTGFDVVSNYQSAPLSHTELEPLSGNDPEDCPTTKCSIGATFIIESIKTSNTKLYYDFGNGVGVEEVIPGTSTATIANFDPAKLVIYGAVGSGGSSDPLEFTYQLVDAAGISSAPATYSVSTSSSLPVTLTSFTAKKGEGFTARLDWTTTAETNSEKFEVEHSTDAKIWNVVTTIASKGESNELARYNYTHTTPLSGENLYRLKMMDRDGTFAYSRINSVDFTIGVQATLYPNPASDKIKVKLEGAASGDVTKVNVFDLNGKMVYKANKLVQGEIDVRNLAIGAYVVTITLKNGTTQNSKIVIVK